MTDDFYNGAARAWADGAALVYAPLAARLLERTPVRLTGSRVLDVGAGTGVAESPLREARAAAVVSLDRSYDMLAFDRERRPAAVVADVMQLPMRAGSFNVITASFVLNHLADPVGGFFELAGVLRAGGVILASVFADSSTSAARDRIDEIAQDHGWAPPPWYRELKDRVIPLLGAPGPMARAAAAAGLVDIDVEETAVDIGLTDPRAPRPVPLRPGAVRRLARGARCRRPPYGLCGRGRGPRHRHGAVPATRRVSHGAYAGDKMSTWAA